MGLEIVTMLPLKQARVLVHGTEISDIQITELDFCMIDRRRLHREIRKAWRKVVYLSDGSPGACRWLARKYGVRL